MKQFPHQIAATEALCDRQALLIGFRPGRGKSRAVIDAACVLFREGTIDTVLVVAPNGLRSIWADPDPVLGEAAKWMWQPHTITEYHAKTNLRTWRPEGLAVVVTNPEFLRRAERLDPLVAWLKGRRTLLVLDESWLYKNYKSQQTKAMATLRKHVQRVVALNGTLGSPKDQYSQFMLLDPRIFDGMNWWQWRARFAKMGGWMSKQIVGYVNQEEYATRTAPFVLTDDGGDDFARIAPPVRTQIEVPLTPKTWALYQDLRTEFVAWLDAQSSVPALQAGVRAMRLAQIVSGFVGGVEVDDADLLTQKDINISFKTEPTIREVGREKLDALIQLLADEGHPSKVLIFTKFRADVERTVRVLTETYPNHRVLPLYGQQVEAERAEAKRLLAPGGDPTPALIVANAATGGAGLNLAAASLCIFLSNDYAWKTRAQAEGRVDRTGQTAQVRFVDILATGPAGQKTIDHGIVSALRKQEDLALTTLGGWL